MKNPRRLTLVAFTICFGLMSCAINPGSEKNAYQFENDVTVATKNKTVATSDYRLGPDDVIDVKFFNNEKYNETVKVRPDGRISLQRVGDVDVKGLSISDLDEIITRAYGEILVDPDVTVILRESGGYLCYVMGEVENPGSYSVTKGMSILRAIATAGGPRHTAKMSSIILIRSDNSSNLHAERIDLHASNLKALLENDHPIQPYDLVYVPKTFVSDLDVFVSQIYRIVMPPLDLVSRWNVYKSIF